MYVYPLSEGGSQIVKAMCVHKHEHVLCVCPTHQLTHLPLPVVPLAQNMTIKNMIGDVNGK